MKKLIIACLCPISLFAQTVAQKADLLLTSYHQQSLFTGNVLIAEKGKVIFSKSYGQANQQKQAANTTATTFRIGSIAKSFTAVIILQLQEEGLLQVNDHINQYLPDYPKGETITIAQLLSNTSGIKDFIEIKGLFPWTKFKDYKELIPIFSKEPLLFTPGERFDYSSSNFLLLCAIAEKVTGKKYAELLAARITNKLQMKNTGIDYMDRKDPNKAIGYEASLTDFYTPAATINIEVLGGAGGMYSNVKDLLIFERALQEGKLLKESSAKLLFTPNKNDYGFGFEINKLNNQTVIGHSGAINGFKANLITFPETATTLIILSNYADIQSFELYESLKRIALNLPFEMPKDRRFIHLEEEELKKYVGEYAVNDKISLTLRLEKGKLIANIAGEDGLVLYPENRDSYYLRTKNAEIKLIRATNDEVTAVQVIKGTRVSTWKRK